MDANEQFLARTFSPQFLPGETPRCAAYVGVYRSGGNQVGGAAIKVLAKQGGALGALAGAAVGGAAGTEPEALFLLFTTERLYVGETSVADPPRPEIDRPMTLELAEIHAVTTGMDGGEWVEITHSRGRAKFFLDDRSPVSSQQTTRRELLPWLSRAAASGELRTPERMARIAERDRLAREEQARRQEEGAKALDAHVRATIDRQPADKYQQTIVFGVCAAACALVLLYFGYEAISALSGVVSSSSDALSNKSAYERKRQGDLAKEQLTRFVGDGVGVLVMGGGAVGLGLMARRRRKEFVEGNVKLREQYGLARAG